MKTARGISYQTRVTVYLDGQPVGDILEASGGGFRYYPKGSDHPGEVFPTVAAVKASIEAT